MNMRTDELNASMVEGFVEFRPVFLLRIPANNYRRALRPDVGDVRLVGPDLIHRRTVIDDQDRLVEGLARSLNTFDVGGRVSDGTGSG